MEIEELRMKVSEKLDICNKAYAHDEEVHMRHMLDYDMGRVHALEWVLTNMGGKEAVDGD